MLCFSFGKTTVVFLYKVELFHRIYPQNLASKFVTVKIGENFLVRGKILYVFLYERLQQQIDNLYLYVEFGLFLILFDVKTNFTVSEIKVDENTLIA